MTRSKASNMLPALIITRVLLHQKEHQVNQLVPFQVFPPSPSNMAVKTDLVVF